MRLARCLSQLRSEVKPSWTGYNWMGDHLALGIVPC